MKEIYLAGICTELGSDIETIERIADRFGIKPEEITRKSGITCLRRFGDKQNFIETVARTVHRLLDLMNISPKDITGIFGSSSFTSPTIMPTFTAHVAYQVGLRNVICDHVGLGCGGGLQALRAVFNQLTVDASEGRIGSYLVVMGDDVRRILDKSNLNTNIFFSDGCAVLLVTNDPALATGYRIEYIRSTAIVTGDYGMLQIINPFTSASSRPSAGSMTMNGPAVLSFVEGVGAAFKKLAGTGAHRIKDGYFIPHQANYGALAKVGESMGLRADQFYTDGIRTVGNLLNASTFFGLEDAFQHNLIPQGVPVFLGAFGAEQQVSLARLIPLAPHRMFTQD